MERDRIEEKKEKRTRCDRPARLSIGVVWRGCLKRDIMKDGRRVVRQRKQLLTTSRMERKGDEP